MQPYEYTTMHQFEDHYWWYSGFRRILSRSLENFLKPTSQMILLDAGCGTGGNLTYLRKILNPSKLCAIDIHPSALHLTNTRNAGADLLQASVNEIPFQKNVFDMVTSFDVLCIRGINDLGALREFNRTLKSGGLLLINIPAYEFLRGEHDNAVHTDHRYSANELNQKLKSAGFIVKRITYWNALLLPFIFIWRKINTVKKNPAAPQSDFRNLPTWINEVLKFVLRIEERLLSFLNLPFGTSILAIAQKPFIPTTSDLKI